MRHAIRLLTLLLLLTPAALAQEQEAPTAPSLKGKFLVADPAMPDPRFAGTVIFMIAHSREGAVGLIVNRPGAKRPVADLLRAFGLPPAEGQGAAAEIEPFWGGPVENDRVILLHSEEFKAESTVAVAPGVALTMPKDALAAIGAGRGPKRTLLAVGYAGWSAGQLERELEMKSWAVIGAGPELLFEGDAAGKWERAWRMRTQEL
jgi:putative transcriptional regulator